MPLSLSHTCTFKHSEHECSNNDVLSRLFTCFTEFLVSYSWSLCDDLPLLTGVLLDQDYFKSVQNILGQVRTVMTALKGLMHDKMPAYSELCQYDL